MPKFRAIEFLGRRVRINEDYTCGFLGPDGRLLGKLIEVPAGSVGTVKSITGGLTVNVDGGGVLSHMKQDKVTLLPR